MDDTDGWPECLAYLQAHCNPCPGPFPPETVLYALVLWTLTQCIGAKRILEVGIGPTSVSGCTFLHALQPGGRLWSVDIDQNLPQQRYRDLAASKGICWQQTYGDSLEVEVPVKADSIDLLYIDGNHDREHAEGDLAKFLPVLRKGGYLVIDDFPPMPGQGAGRVAMDALIAPGQFVHLAHHPPHGNGRLLWQRPL